MKFLVGDKLILNQSYDPNNEMYPIGLKAVVMEYGIGGMYKLKLSTGETAEWSEPLMEKVFKKLTR